MQVGLFMMAGPMLWFLSHCPGNHCYSVNVTRLSGNPIFIKPGGTAIINVTYVNNFTHLEAVKWYNSQHKLILWKNETGQVIKYDERVSLVGQATLVIENITSWDNGTYKIEIYTFHVHDESMHTDVVVLEEPSAVLKDCPSTYTVEEGAAVRCGCATLGGNPPPYAMWIKDGKLVTGPDSLTSFLSIKRLSKEECGHYICFVRSRGLNDTKDFYLQMKNSSGPGSEKPRAIIKDCPSTYTVEEGAAVRCGCATLGGNPPLYAMWIKDGKLVTGPDSLTSFLSIKRLSKEECGHYICLVRSRGLNDTKDFYLQMKNSSGPGSGDRSSSGVKVWVVVLIVILFIIVFFFLGYFCGTRNLLSCKNLFAERTRLPQTTGKCKECCQKLLRNHDVDISQLRA